jgi:hypothetical protein
MAALLGNVCFAADDGLQPTLLGRLMKLHGREKVTVIGNRQGFHSVKEGSVNESWNLACAIEKAVVRVQMQVDEFLRRHGRMIADSYR